MTVLPLKTQKVGQTKTSTLTYIYFFYKMTILPPKPKMRVKLKEVLPCIYFSIK